MEMSQKLAKYIITTGEFDGETNNFKQAQKELKTHTKKMKELFPDTKNTYGIYMLLEKSNG